MNTKEARLDVALQRMVALLSSLKKAGARGTGCVTSLKGRP